MPATRTYKTPGVYVREETAFPPSIVGVQTALPAFVGYTEKAEIDGKPVPMKPIPIGSLADYEEVFGGAFRTVYTLEEVAAPVGDDFDFKVLQPGQGTKYYNLSRGTQPRFNLYNSLRLFYENGGGNCYVVSVGNYRNGDSFNAVAKSALVAGLEAVAEQSGPTLLVVPDAVLLPPDAAEDVDGDKILKPWKSEDFKGVVEAMLRQCGELQDRVAVLDVYGSNLLGQPPAQGEEGVTVERATLPEVVETFRGYVGTEFLSYGMAYLPFLESTVVPISSIDYTNVDIADSTPTGGGLLQTVLTWESETLYATNPARKAQVQADINSIAPEQQSLKTPQVTTLNQNLTAALPLLVDIERQMAAKDDTLPPSAAMAGVYTYVDGTKGVWNAPANLGLASVARPSFKIGPEEQQDLNVPVNGKAIDAIREFPGRGTVVWGARTLDGNSNDYRYIQVRRTLIYIEQSIKAALDPFVFAANDGKTWATVVSMISGFLRGVWEQGGLMGATPAEAYSVACGVGSTMTGKDILEGYMRVQVLLQMIRPAEFIELNFRQRMQGVG